VRALSHLICYTVACYIGVKLKDGVKVALLFRMYLFFREFLLGLHGDICFKTIQTLGVFSPLIGFQTFWPQFIRPIG